MLRGTSLEAERNADQQDQRAQAGSGQTELWGRFLEGRWIRAGFLEKVELSVKDWGDEGRARDSTHLDKDLKPDQ